MSLLMAPRSRKATALSALVGVLGLTVAGKTQTIASCDSFAYESNLPLTCHILGDEPTTAVWVVKITVI